MEHIKGLAYLLPWVAVAIVLTVIGTLVIMGV